MLMVSVLSFIICVYNINFPYQVSDVRFRPEDHPPQLAEYIVIQAVNCLVSFTSTTRPSLVMM